MVHNVPDESFADLVKGWESFFIPKGTLELGWNLGPETPLIPYKFCKTEHLLDQSKTFGICVKFSSDPDRVTDLVVEATSVNGIPEKDTGCLFYPSGTRVLGILPTPNVLIQANAFDTKQPEFMDIYLVAYLLAVAFKDDDLRSSLIAPIMVNFNTRFLEFQLN